MKLVAFLPALVLAVGLGTCPAPAWAANADHPDRNVDPRNDAGNDTGNSQVDRLNSGQLDENQGSPARGVPGPAAPPATDSHPPGK